MNAYLMLLRWFGVGTAVLADTSRVGSSQLSLRLLGAWMGTRSWYERAFGFAPVGQG